MANNNQAEMLWDGTKIHQTLLDGVNMPMVYYAPDGRFLFMNAFARQNLNSAHHSFRGTTLYDLLPGMADELRIRNRMLTERGVGRQYEDTIELTTGVRCFSSMAQPLIDEDGKVFAIQVISQDVTKYQRAMNILNNRNDRLPPRVPSSNAWGLLTSREKEIFELTAMGYNRVNIADQLCISPRTVEVHRSNAMNKLGFHNKTDIIRFAIRKGIIPL